MATSFRRKKHQNERASEDSDFFCTHFQMCAKHLKQYRPLETILCFSRWSTIRTTTASQKQKQIGLEIPYFFRTNFQFKSFPAFFTISRVCMIKPLLWIREKYVLSWNTDNYKVWNKFWVVGNLLRWTPFVVFQNYSLPFFDQMSFKRYLQPVIWGLTALSQKNKKDKKEFWWKK